MMDKENYDDYLVDKAKELLHEDLSDAANDEVEKPEMRKKRNQMDETVDEESTSNIPVAWDPREVQHLVNNRKKMDNKELEEFMEKDHEVQEELKEMDEWKGFTRWEERFMIQNYRNMSPEEIAAELEREEREVKLKIRVMGLKIDD